MNYNRFSHANKRMAMIATGGLGVWAIVAMRQAARRSASTFTRATGSQAPQPLTQQQSDAAVQQYMTAQPIHPMQTAQPLLQYQRKRYEPQWVDDWDFDSTAW